MSGLAIHDVLRNRVLVTRESARGIAPAVASAVGRSGEALLLDFSDIQGMTPSFLDELLSVVQEIFDGLNKRSFRLEIVNPPTMFSSKFAAVGRGRGLSISESMDGRWIVEVAHPGEVASPGS